MSDRDLSTLSDQEFCAQARKDYLLSVHLYSPGHWAHTLDEALRRLTAAGARERALRKAIELGLRVLDGVLHYERIPKSCGACGTPNAACDGDCVDAAYIARDIEVMRRALLAGAVPSQGPEEK